MNIYLVCTIRNATVAFAEHIKQYVAMLEQRGHRVYFPPRDTDQNDDTGLRICKDNRKGIESADEVHVMWDGSSQGSIFDLGMAFALRKKVVPVMESFPAATVDRSIPNIVHEWSKRGPE
jgi:nucleoside 2-deoxyribosyltransferase